MTNSGTLEKLTKYIGIFTKKLLIIVYIGFLIINFLMNYINEIEDSTSLVIWIIGIIIIIFIVYKLINVLLNPSIGFGEVKNQYISNQIDKNTYLKKWKNNLICSIIFSILFLFPTLGFSILLMIPNYILLYNSRIVK